MGIPDQVALKVVLYAAHEALFLVLAPAQVPKSEAFDVVLEKQLLNELLSLFRLLATYTKYPLAPVGNVIAGVINKLLLALELYAKRDPS